jgi:hypothetical protein
MTQVDTSYALSIALAANTLALAETSSPRIRSALARKSQSIRRALKGA